MDAATDKQLGVLNEDLTADRCFKQAQTLNPDGSWQILSECNLGSGGIKSYSGVIEGDYATSYRFTIRAQTMSAKIETLNRVVNLSMIAKRVGTCAKDQVPGDMVESGIKLNLYDMAGKKR